MQEIETLDIGFAREYMGRVRSECLMLAALSGRASETRARLCHASGVSLDAVPKNPNAYGDAIPDGLVKVEELEEGAAFVDMELIRHAGELVRHVSDSRAREVCRLYYLDALSWSEVERTLNYFFSQSTLKRYANAGLLEISEMEPLARAPRHPAL